jgi:hypothetical protein
MHDDPIDALTASRIDNALRKILVESDQREGR